jgi:peroxiredoxin
MRKRFLLIAVTIVCCFWILGATADVPTQLQVGAAAPNFELVADTGEKVSLAQLKGKTVVLEWANPDCPFVKRHYAANTMELLAKQYSSQDVVWLAINSSKTATHESNRAWKAAEGFAYPVLDDNSGSVGKLYGARTTPHMYVVDKEGILRYQGAIDSDSSGDEAQATNYVKQALDELLAGKAVTTPQSKPYGCSVKYRS